MKDFAKKIRSGDRRSIAKAITLIESSRGDHQDDAQALLNELLPHTGNAIRLGLTGVPGVGKSTFIESFGTMLTKAGKRIAVLAVDPSSQITGGSILGDKTRMEELARDPNAFVRPTPSKGTLGGTARYTREAMMVLEAAGYDVILVETVGVGQSEVAVSKMVDMFILLLSPGTGDELQGIKRGIMELADLIVINKADGDFKNAARIALSDVKNAVHLMRPRSENWSVDVLESSALERTGLEDIWQQVIDFQKSMMKSGEFHSKRIGQDNSSIWSELNELLIDSIKENYQDLIHELEKSVKNKSITARQAATELLSKVSKS